MFIRMMSESFDAPSFLKANIAVNIGQINVLETFIRTESINIAFNKLRFLGLNAETV